MKAHALVLAAFVAFSAVLATPSLAAGALADKTVLVMCFESTDGKLADRCAMNASLQEAVRNEGGLLVDAAQAERLRKQYGPERFRDDAGLKGVDLLDAELAVVVEVSATTLGTTGGVGRYSVDLAWRAIDPSRARVLAVVADRVELNQTSAAFAITRAVEKSAEKRASFFASLKAAASAPTDVDLWVYGIVGVEDARVIEALLSKTGVCSAQKRVALQGDFAKWRATLAPKKTIDDLAKVLEGGDLLLVVEGETGGMLQMARRPDRAMKVPVLVEIAAEKGVPKNVVGAVDDALTTTLLTVPWIDARRAATDAPAVKLAVSVAKSGASSYALRAEVADTSGKKVAARRATATSKDVDAAAAVLSKGVLDDVRAWLEKSPGKERELARALKSKQPVAVTPTLAAPAIDSSSSSSSLARVRVEPRLDGLRVRSRVVDRTEWSAWVESSDGVAADASLPRDLDEKLLSLNRVLPVVIELEAEGKIGERMVRESTRVVTVVRPRGTVRWSDPTSIAKGFGYTSDFMRSALSHAADAAHVDAASGPTRETRVAAAVVDAVFARVHVFSDGSSAGIADSAGGGDASSVVAIPDNVWISKSGDADDVAGLMSTALLGAGLNVRAVIAFDEPLIAVDTGAPSSAWALFASKRTGVLDVDGRAWLPLSLRKSTDFWAAAREGGTRMASAKKPLVVPLSAHPSPIRVGVVVGSAERPPLSTTTTRVLVLDATGGDASASAAATNDVTKYLASSPALKALSVKDVRDMLNVEAQRQLTGCSDNACYIEIANAVGARFVVTTALSKSGTLITALDTAAVEARVRETATSSADMRAAVAKVVAGLAPDAPLPPSLSYALHLRELVHADPRAVVRALAIAGDVDGSKTASSALSDAKERALVEATLLGLRGDANALPALRALGTKDGTYNAAVFELLRGGSPVVDDADLKALVERKKRGDAVDDAARLLLRF